MASWIAASQAQAGAGISGGEAGPQGRPMKVNEDYREGSPVALDDHIERYMYRKAAMGGWYVIDQDEPATVLCFVIGKEDAEQIVFALNYAEEFCQ